MKTYIDKLLLFLVLICSCNTNDKDNQDIWIGTYSIHDFDTENEIIRDGQRRLLIFESDSLRVKDFPHEIWSDVPLDFVYKYQLKDDMLLLNDKSFERIERKVFERK
ncbi:hypothetical protein [Lewinella cohaerens]|uniref:hypothetical protein n=1 Tax=Lewinella cohaerens TaxID=70995 RepID=UPI000374DC5B|nr:hypothetical protein [Lewinella cohaerens]